MLAGPDQDELLRQRRAELAAIRRELEALPGEIRKAGEECLALAKAELRAALKKYSPDQPRAPAGNRDGGQWTSGSKAGNEAPVAPVRYASLEIPVGGARPDMAASGGITVNANAADTQNVVGNLYNVLATIVRSLFGPKIDKIWADQIPVDHPRYPEQFVDGSGEPIIVQGNPVLRPANLPPERYMEAALAMREFVAAYEQGGIAAEGASPLTAAALALLPLAPGGPLEAERFDWTYVRDYRHYQNIMIGVYGAAAGLSSDDVLSLVDLYARFVSDFGEPKDEVYTHSAKQDVEDTKLGYRLYQSGRLRLRDR